MCNCDVIVLCDVLDLGGCFFLILLRAGVTVSWEEGELSVFSRIFLWRTTHPHHSTHSPHHFRMANEIHRSRLQDPHLPLGRDQGLQQRVARKSSPPDGGTQRTWWVAHKSSPPDGGTQRSWWVAHKSSPPSGGTQHHPVPSGPLSLMTLGSEGASAAAAISHPLQDFQMLFDFPRRL